MTQKRLPDVSVGRMRTDFEMMFNMHSHKCLIVKYLDAQGGDFFDEAGSRRKRYRSIIISIQGSASNISRLTQGIEPPKGRIRCYARYNEKIDPTDLIKFNNKYFKINNLQDNIKNGEVIFQSFDLEYSTMRSP